jgi:hypothetical protein
MSALRSVTIVGMVEPAGATFPGKNGKIAFWSSRDGNYEIYTMNPNGQGLDTLTTKNDDSPDWQPLSPGPKKPGPPNKKRHLGSKAPSLKQTPRQSPPKPPSGQPSRRR